MDNFNLNIILTSTILSGLVSAIVSSIVTIWLKRLDFKYAYRKTLIDKRLEAYKHVELLISDLKSTAFDPRDGRGYNKIFAHGKSHFFDCRKNLLLAMHNNIWINDETLASISELNQVLVCIDIEIEKQTEDDISEIGKSYYRKLAVARNLLEEHVRKDLINLHNFSKFDKSKTNTKFRPTKIEDCIP